MASVNVFIGGTGVNLAVLVKAYSDFYELQQAPRIFAIDTDSSSQDVAQRSLGRALVLAAPGFLERVRDRIAKQWLQESWSELWEGDDGRRLSFGDPILQSGARVVRDEFETAGGLWTLRGAGWLAFEDIDERNRQFVKSIVTALGEIYETARPRAAPIMNVIASVAGGTGSGLFIPLISAVRDQYGSAPLGVHLHVVLPSAFTNDWKTANEKEEQVYRSRGQSGAYAAYREILQLSEGADKYNPPEPRTVLEFPYRPGLIDKVIWWGRREIDKQRRADDVFYEAGKFVTLLNDTRMANDLLPGAGMSQARRVAGVATIEYPRLEWAQAITAAAIGHMATRVREAKPSTAVERILEQSRNDDSCPPLLRFIHEQRAENQALSSLVPVGDGAFEYKKVKGELVAPLKTIVNDAPSEEPLTNRVEGFQGGSAVGALESYGATTDSAWKEYLDKAFGRFQKLEEMTIAAMGTYCDWLPLACDRWIAGAVARAIQASYEPSTGFPSIERVRIALIDLVEDLDRARLVFVKPPDQSVLGGPHDHQLLGVDQLQRNVDQRKRDLVEMYPSNASFRPQPPRGPQYHPLLQVIFLILTLGFLVAALAAVFPILGGLVGLINGALAWIGGLFGRTGIASIFRGAPSIDLPPGYWAAFSFSVFLFLHVLRERAFKGRRQLRQEAERELKLAWVDLVEFKMLALLWESAVTTCGRVVGEVTKEEVGRDDRTAVVDGSLNSPLRLLDSGSNWLRDLADYADGRRQTATAVRPSWVIPVGDYPEPDDSELKRVMPKTLLRPDAQATVNLERITEIALTYELAEKRNGVSTAPGFAFSRWKAPKDRDEIAHKHTLGRFYADLENSVLKAVSKAGLIVDSLDEAMKWSDTELASKLEDLAERAAERGPAAELTRKETMTLNLCISNNEKLRQRVKRALALAKADPSLTHTHELPDEMLESQNVGESIALISIGLFDDKKNRLADIDGEAHDTYYGIGHVPGRPKETLQYNASNAEFHLLPEFSTAARAETKGRKEPCDPLLIQRLYGSHQAVAAYPSIIEAFYLCRVRGYLKWESDGNQSTYTLRVAGASTPLVSIRELGLPVEEGDDLGAARKEMTGLDAFRTCLSAISLSFHEAPRTDLPPGARMRTDLWPTLARTVLDSKAAILEEWRKLRGDQAAASRASTYKAMRAEAQKDDDAMGRRVRGQWTLLTKSIFDQGESVLAGKAGVWDVQEPVTVSR